MHPFTVKSLPAFARCLVLSVAYCLCLLFCAPVFGEDSAAKPFDLPAGRADQTLKLFSEQSGFGIVAATDVVEGVHTNAVQGKFVPREALDLMLANTGLVAAEDQQAGAFSLRRMPRPAAPSQAAAGPAPKAAPAGTPGAGVLAPQPTVETPTSEVIRLSPFIVDTSQDKGSYQADSTLAGTRVRTDLKDIASSLTVVTAQFMQDIGATNNQTLLQYTPNTEVGGVYGNYAGVGNTFINGASESLTRPDQNTRVRGLDSADNTRDYFRTDLPWDSYVVDRVDLQRGPNSILFGIGSPAGIINASVNLASYKEGYKVENRYGSYGSLRNVLDFNHVLLPDELAIRVAALDDNTKYRQQPAYNHDQRIFGAVRWDPRFFGLGSAHTTIRANYEHGAVRSNNPRILPPVDAITPFFDSGAINKTTWDPAYAWDAGVQASSGSANPTLPGLRRNPWITGSAYPGLQQLYNPVFYYNNANNPSTPVSAVQGSPYLYFGIGSDGSRVGSIGGMPYDTYSGIARFGTYAVLNNRYNPSDPATAGASAGFYKDKSITDPSIFDFYNHLIDGPNKHEWQNWDAFNLALDQTFLNNRMAVDLTYDYQRYRAGQESNFAGSPEISIDINANTTKMPWAYLNPPVTSYNGTGSKGNNPNAGAAFVGGSGNAGGNGSRFTTRENLRGTVTGELRATDFLQQSWLTDLLGRHVFTGLYSKETYDTDSRSWVRYALSPEWLATTGNGDLSVSGLIGGQSIIDWVSYLSGPLFDKSSASGLHLQPITTVQAPSGTATVQWFNSHWKWPMNPTDPST
ncbi:MAG: TonB-dependent receptor plug domain-containing protein [Opitutaceae bacterium]